MRILLIGKNGQLGWELQRTCMTLGEVIAVDYPQVDISQINALRDLIQTVKPHILLNPAAYTNVDKAENEVDLARVVNGVAPGVMAEEMKKLGGALIHYSTDYVFDGKKGSPYNETDVPNPLNVYGKTKLEGEQMVEAIGGSYLIFRTSWVYSMRQGGFVNRVLQWARQQETLRIMDDQTGNPTWARMLAEATAQVIAQGRSEPVDYLQEKAGLCHLAGAGSCSRFEWAKAILELDPKKEEQVVKELLPAETSEFPTPAERPTFSPLDNTKFIKKFTLELLNWKVLLKLAIISF